MLSENGCLVTSVLLLTHADRENTSLSSSVNGPRVRDLAHRLFDTSTIVCIFFICRCSDLLPSATKLGQGYVFTRVCDSVHGWGGVCPIACLDTNPPRTKSRPPPTKKQTPPTAQVNERAIRILLECILIL